MRKRWRKARTGSAGALGQQDRRPPARSHDAGGPWRLHEGRWKAPPLAPRARSHQQTVPATPGDAAEAAAKRLFKWLRSFCATRGKRRLQTAKLPAQEAQARRHQPNKPLRRTLLAEGGWHTSGQVLLFFWLTTVEAHTAVRPEQGLGGGSWRQKHREQERFPDQARGRP